MYQNFKQIDQYIRENKTTITIALAGAHDMDALSALVQAKRNGVAQGILIGDADRTKRSLEALAEPWEDYRFISCEDERESARIAVGLVKSDRSVIPMKGYMLTASFMKAVLDKEEGLLEPGSMLSQATVMEYPKRQRLIIISDCAINIAPGVEEKIKILHNAVQLAGALGIHMPKVALLTPLEVVNEKIVSTVEAQIITERMGNTDPANCMVYGPLALDNAVSPEAAAHKGITSPVAGNADILIVPGLNAGNILTKSITYFARLQSAGTVAGTKSPVIMTSRSDDSETKYHSILLAALQMIGK